MPEWPLALVLGLALLAFLSLGYLSRRIRLPSVTLFVLLGVFFSASVFPVLPASLLGGLDFISDAALAVIGFSIGLELRGSILKTLGKSIFWITFLESVLSFLFVAGTMAFFFPEQLPIAVLLGSIASATAPAATMAVIQQLKAKGPLTTTITAVVGIDDVAALIIFSIALAPVRVVFFSSGPVSPISWLWPLFEIVFSIGLGAIAALPAIHLLKRMKLAEDGLFFSFGLLLVMAGLSNFLGLSTLLGTMTFGLVLTNAQPMAAQRAASAIQQTRPVLLALFFSLAGTRLDLSSLPSLWLPALVYVVARAGGKVFGASAGAAIGKAPPIVRKYVGWSLLPQIGVAVALALQIDQLFRSSPREDVRKIGTMIVGILLATTVFTETIGPFLTRRSLMRAGEAEGGKEA